MERFARLGDSLTDWITNGRSAERDRFLAGLVIGVVVTGVFGFGVGLAVAFAYDFALSRVERRRDRDSGS